MKTAQKCTALIIFVISMFCIQVPIVHAALSLNSSAGSMLRNYLTQQGITVQLEQLHRQDAFSRAVIIERTGLQKTGIGFTDTPFDDGLLLFMTPEGESVVQTEADGSARLISGQQIDIKKILCLLNAGLAFFDDAKTCPQDNTICYIRAVLSLIMYVMDCNESSTTSTIPG